jgi:hypothetical protein
VRGVFAELAPGSIICEPVLTEVCHLVAKEGVAREHVIESIARGRLNPVFLGNELASIAKLLHSYAVFQWTSLTPASCEWLSCIPRRRSAPRTKTFWFTEDLGTSGFR